MSFKYEQISCQDPKNQKNIDRNYIVVRAEFNNAEKHAKRIQEDAWDLAKRVNPKKANDSTNSRDKVRLILDALGGILSEQAWFFYINRVYGKDTVNFTNFISANGQIDLLLKNNKRLEIRSSFPRNGVKFAICNEIYNFKSICKYDNLYKPSESDKDFFGCVLFETIKEDLIDVDNIVLYLIGGSTREMMLDKNLSFTSSLVAEDDLVKIKTNYQVIYLKDALDMNGFENYMASMGLIKEQNYPLNQLF